MKRHMRPRIRWVGVAAVAAVPLLVAMLAFMVSQGAGVRADPGFNPTANITLSDYNSGVNADLTNSFGVPFGDYNYSTFISFIPAEFFPGEDVPLGAKVGELDSLATLGLLNGPCFTPLAPHFDLYRASTDTSDTITWAEQFANDPPPHMHAGMHDGIYHFPDLITRILPGETPVERMYGYANVGGSDVTINFVVLEAGALGYPAAWGRPSVTLLNDIGDPGGIPEPSAITSFCTPLDSETVTFGLSQDNPETGGDNEADYEVRRNPAYGGTYTFRWFAAGMIDADGDGIANYNDTCPYDVNKGDFRLGHTDGGGDGAAECDGDVELSGDGIDCACDPDPNRPGMSPQIDLTHCWLNSPGASTLDCDGDFFDNRGDNCPLVANPLQEDEDADTIGDDCDDNPTTADGEAIEVTLEEDVDISGPLPGADSDGDGFDDVTEGELGSDPEDADSTPEDTSVAGTCTDEEDNDLDGYIDYVDGGCGDDTDEDGASDEGEDDLGSDPEDADSTPEDTSVAGTCTDGEDNDGDSLTDGDDPGCAVAEETPTPTPTPEYCAPVFPGTYNGLVHIDGQPAADDTIISAVIDGITWGTTTTSGGRYALDIPQTLPVTPPCFEGGSLTFQCDSTVAAETVEWSPGLHDLNLTCGIGVTVEVDIKPGNKLNSTNPGSKGVIPVAILTSDEFDATTVDPHTVRFGPEGALVDTIGGGKLKAAIKDVNHDGDSDLIMHFRTQQTGIAPGDIDACLMGQTYDGVPIVGCDSVRTVPPEADADGDSHEVGLPRVFGDDIEASVQTDQEDACPDDPNDNAWPPDFNNDTAVDILDVLLFRGRILSALGDPGYEERFDLSFDGTINIVDVVTMRPFIMTSCE